MDKCVMDAVTVKCECFDGIYEKIVLRVSWMLWQWSVSALTAPMRRLFYVCHGCCDSEVWVLWRHQINSTVKYNLVCTQTYTMIILNIWWMMFYVYTHNHPPSTNKSFKHIASLHCYHSDCIVHHHSTFHCSDPCLNST